MIDTLALIISALAFVFAALSYYLDTRRKAKLETLNAYRLLQKSALDHINQWTPSEIRKAVQDKRSEEYKQLSGYLAEIEHFCVGLNTRIYDYKTFYNLAHGYFDSDRGMLKPRLLPLLETKQKNAKEDYYANLHRVWARMEKSEKLPRLCR